MSTTSNSPAPHRKRKRAASFLFLVLSLVVSLATSCATQQAFDNSIRPITKPYAFSIGQWELKMASKGPGQPLFAHKPADGVTKVKQYFALGAQISRLQSELNRSHETTQTASLETQMASLKTQQTGLTGTVVTTLQIQIREVLNEQSIFNPLYQNIGLNIGFPPVVFTLQSSPHLLVISPRDKIESFRTVLLQQDLTPDAMKTIESDADKLDVSSLVTEIGGFAAVYPTFVSNDMNLRSTIVAATHEWMHQYLAFRPLGFLYVMDLAGVARNYDIAQMNETVAGILGEEIGGLVYQKYYAPSEPVPPPTIPSTDRFDFNKAMRETRQTVDKLLAEGKIDEAEQFMEQERQILETKGYYIRKLNQAYFAFYGTYGDSPTSVSAIGRDIRALRTMSVSLKDFLEKTSGITSPKDLKRLLTAADSSGAP